MNGFSKIQNGLPALIIFIFFIISLILSCKKEKTNTIQCNNTNLNPDSILYSKTISIIIKQNCLHCHNNSIKKGWVNLEGYEHVKKYADNHKLLGSIAHLKGYKAMPRETDMLSIKDICKIKFWIDYGARNN